MTDLRKAAQQALDVLIRASSYYDTYPEIAALEAALAEQDAEPVAWQYVWPNGDRYTTSTEAAVQNYALGAEQGLLPEHLGSIVPLYAHPPRREWQGLTDEEIEVLMDTYDVASIEYARAIEAALKEKNGA